MSTPERCTPHSIAWSADDRKQMMRDVIRMLAGLGALRIQNAPAIATTYSVNPCEVEAEMMKHLQEGGEGK